MDPRNLARPPTDDIVEFLLATSSKHGRSSIGSMSSVRRCPSLQKRSSPRTPRFVNQQRMLRPALPHTTTTLAQFHRKRDDMPRLKSGTGHDDLSSRRTLDPFRSPTNGILSFSNALCSFVKATRVLRCTKRSLSHLVKKSVGSAQPD